MSKNITQKPSKNTYIKDLLLLFAIPIAIALIAAALIYIPRLTANPSYDFIYSICEDYRCSNNYVVDATGHISVSEDTTEPLRNYRTASLKYYDAANDSTRTLTVDQARTYTLNTSSKSPDDYTLTHENSRSGFLFWSESNTGWYLKDGTKKKKIDLLPVGSYSSRDITFLGWINK